MQLFTGCCNYCEKEVKMDEFHVIYKMTLVTDAGLHFIGLKTLLEELDTFLTKRGSHISPSQVILLRPDIMKDFFNMKIPTEHPVYWFLSESTVCHECFESYKTLVPEK